MRPRSWLESFLATAAPAGLAFGLGWKVFTGEAPQTSTLLGLAFGVVVGLIAAPKAAEIVVTRPFTDRQAFLTGLETRLAELDLYPKTQLENFRTYESVPAGSFSLGFVSLSGIVKRVRIRLDANQATVVGPREIISQLGTT
jgi:hypothetical protein